MDQNPEYDYEMHPQAAYSGFQGTAEMEDLDSEGMAMEDARMHNELIDKVGIDMDFQDFANPNQGIAAFPVSNEAPGLAPSAIFENDRIPEIVHVPSEDHIYEVEADQEPGRKAAAPFETPTDVDEYFQHNGEHAVEGVDEDDHHRGDVRPLQNHPVRSHGGYEGEKDNELNQNADHSDAENGIQLAATLEEKDELEGNVCDAEYRRRGGEGEPAQDTGSSGMDGYYPSAAQEVETIRVTFNGQDFVMWSATDISAYFALADKAQGTEESHEQDELLQVEAPALDVQQDVLWQPLESLFASLREKKALGEFLEESQELHIAFPDLDLDVAEDNLYCREITLDDLLQLHHGLGLTTSLHIQVSERPRFITKYNELAQHVAGILGSQLQHISDDSEQEESANPSQRPDAWLRSAEDPADVETKNSGNITLPQERSGAQSTVDHYGVEASGHDGRSPEVPTEAIQTTAILAAQNDLRNDRHQSGVSIQDPPESPSGKTRTSQQVSSENTNEPNKDGNTGYDPQLDQQAFNEESLQHERATQDSRGAQAPVDETQEQQERDEAENVVKEGLDQVEAEEGCKAVEEEADDEELVSKEAAEGEVQYDMVQVKDEAEGEWVEDDDEEYAEDAEYNGEEAEQTFYTSINQGSEGEEDELEDPDLVPAEGTRQAEGGPSHGRSSEDFDSTYAYEAADGEQDWQEETEEQIVEYTEEQSDGIVNVVSPSSATSYQIGAQRKRGVIDEDDEAEVEIGDYETENKRVKVD